MNEHGAPSPPAGDDDRKVAVRRSSRSSRSLGSALGIALGLLIDWFPVQASTQAEQIDTL